MRIPLVGILVSLLLVSAGYASSEAHEAIVVIAHPQVAVERLDRDALRSIFSMRLRVWPGTDNPIRVFSLPDRDPLHAKYAKELLGVYPYQLRLAWDRLVFSGTGQAPTLVTTEAEMIESVAATPGSVGYIPRSAVSSASPVRIVHLK